MAEVQWIKLYIDMFDKRKINKLRRLPAGNDILLIWIMLLAMAGKCNAGGMIFITESVPFTVEDLADELDFEINTIRLALEAFQQFDMADVSDNGFISICNWEEYQNIDGMDKIREQTRKRVAKCRQKKALESGNAECNATVTHCNATEEEREKEKEGEYHSFIHSAKNDDEFLDEDERREALLSQQRTALQGKLGGGVVFLSDEQINDLLEKLSLDEFHHYIGIVRDCELKGKKFKKKTHYQAIIDMATKDRKVLPNGG